MSKRDFYEILGVNKNANDDEIKKAYRKMAMKYHPDRNPTNKEAEEMFKEAAEAYEVLSDSNKRARYNQFGHAGVGGAASSGFSNAEDIFESFGSIFEDMFGFSGGGGRRRQGNQPRQGANLKYSLTISFEESIKGVERELQIPKHVPCTTCHGTGAAPGTSPRTCNTCGGSGQVAYQQGFFRMAQPCPDCDGTGQKIDKKCPDCKGHKVIEKVSNIKVKIPAGMDNGMRMRLSNEGEAGAHGGPAGDLYLFIEVEEHPRFKREEYDLIYRLPLTMVQAVTGCVVEIDCFEEKPRKVTIPAGVQPFERIRVPDAGVPRLSRSGRGKGDLIVEVQVHIPKKVSPKALEHLTAFAEEMGESAFAEMPKKEQEKSFFEKIFG